MVDPGRHRRGLAGVAAELDDPEVGVGARQLEAALEGPILAAVVDEDDFAMQPERAHRFHDRPVQEVDVLLLVVQGHDDRQITARFGILGGLAGHLSIFSSAKTSEDILYSPFVARELTSVQSEAVAG